MLDQRIWRLLCAFATGAADFAGDLSARPDLVESAEGTAMAGPSSADRQRVGGLLSRLPSGRGHSYPPGAGRSISLGRCGPIWELLGGASGVRHK